MIHAEFRDELVAGVVYNPFFDKLLDMLQRNPDMSWRKVIDMFLPTQQGSALAAIINHRLHYGLSFRHSWKAYLRFRDGQAVGFKQVEGRCACVV